MAWHPSLALRRALPLAALLLCLVGMAAAQTSSRENLARGRSYVLDPAPNYALCTDPGDATQLTDGVYTEGYFWTQPTTVGWSEVKQAVITVDLGSVRPIGGVSFSTASRPEVGALWPRGILIRVSDDGQQWWEAGELTSLAAAQGALPEDVLTPAQHYARRYWSNQLRAQGRYVAFVVVPDGQYTFCDEVEVYPGDEATVERTGKPFSTPGEAVAATLSERDAYHLVVADAARIGRELASATIPDSLRSALTQELATVLQGPGGTPAPVYHEVFPLNDMHRRVLQIGGRLWAAEGRPALQAWCAGRWDSLEAHTAPPPGIGSTTMRVTLMRGEVRAAALNLTNATAEPMRLDVRLEGGAGLSSIRLHQVAWTVASGGVVAAALPAANRTAAGWEVTVPAGTTRQVWCSVDGRRMPSGSHLGTLIISGRGAGRVAVPLRVRVSPLVMPKQLALSLGGWDYTDGPELYNTSETVRRALIRFLREYQVDAPWATKQVMRFGTHAADGTMTKPPDTAAMDDWLRRWPGVRWYCVFNNFEGVDAANPRDLPVGSPAWQSALREWITFWVGHLQQKGIPASRLCLLLVDEPRNAETDNLTLAYARVIRAAQPDVVLWTDPIWEDPRQADPALHESMSVIARSGPDGWPAPHCTKSCS